LNYLYFKPAETTISMATWSHCITVASSYRLLNTFIYCNAMDHYNYIDLLHYKYYKKKNMRWIIVLRPGPVADLVQGPGSGFWQGHRVGRVSFFFKSKQRYSSKKKVNGFATGSWPGRRVTPGFFFNPVQFQSRIDLPGQTEFQNYAMNSHMMKSYIIEI
jgi:hypothetical protein